MLKRMKSQRKIRPWYRKERIFIEPSHANDNLFVACITSCSPVNTYPHRVLIHRNGVDELFENQIYKICLSHKGDRKEVPGKSSVYQELYYFIFSPDDDVKKMGELHVRYFKQKSAPADYSVKRVIWADQVIYELDGL